MLYSPYAPLPATHSINILVVFTADLGSLFSEIVFVYCWGRIRVVCGGETVIDLVLRVVGCAGLYDS